ncbi:sodium/hydrogen exchanger 10 isoform X1 [Fukomys damarensis]|uniref:sodium/hydrogen exchanger 10 isoform X1 n=1 Tax=Fukomys damarensis TaxID=885580 RepID=UPI00053F2CFE|nr:sodium/hydrogen exchanger 10 isoform X1 [Fukomys damarensis]
MDEIDLSHVIFHNTSDTWLSFIQRVFLNSADDLPEIILIVSLICTIGAFLNMHLKIFLIPVPVILFLLGCCLEILSFTSFEIQRYAVTIQWMNPELFFGIFIPVIMFNVALEIDVYMLQKLMWQIFLIAIPGFFVNYMLILWYLQSVNKLLLKPMQWSLFSVILMSSDPLLTAAAIKDLGLSKSLISLINGESVITCVIALIVFSTTMDINMRSQHIVNHNLAHDIMLAIWTDIVGSLLFGILSSKLIQSWMSDIHFDDVSYTILIFTALYLIYYICELVGLSGIFTITSIGLFLNSTSFKPRIGTLLFELWDCLTFIALLMVFSFSGLLIPAHTYLYISFSDIYYSLNIYFTVLVFRFLLLLFLSPILTRFGRGFTWRWSLIIAWSEMKGIPNINMALLFAYSDASFGSVREKSQILFHGMTVCLINLIVHNFILPMAVTKLGLRDVTSTKYKSNLYTFQRFQELIKSTASTLKFDKDLANSEWSMVDKAILLQNPFALSQEEAKEREKLKCPSCNKEIDEAFTIEAMELAGNLLLSAQIASYRRQYKSEILSQNAVLVLVGASESFGEKKGEYINPEKIKKYFESKNLLGVFRKVLLNLLYNTKKDKGVPSKYHFLRTCHNIISINEFEYIGYLAILMNTFPIIISWISLLNEIYVYEIRHASYFFLTLYILEALLKITAMQKEYFSYSWNLFELAITFIGILDVILFETGFTAHNFILTEIMKNIPLLRIARVLKLITPKLLQIIDKKMSHQQSFRYAILKGYIQGEIDAMNIIDEIATSNQVKEMLLKRETKNMECAMKELGYLEYDHPEIGVTMKTKEEINVMLNMANEILKSFETKGIINKNESAEISKLIMSKKREIHDFQSIIKPLTVEEILYHIPWLEKNPKYIDFIQARARIVTFDCGNDIFQENDEPRGIYIIISGMVKLQREKSDSEVDYILLESEERAYPIANKDYVLGGETIGELNCLTDEPMQYSATCKTVVETYFIPKAHLYEGFQKYCPLIEQKMWLKIGRGVAARKIREHLSYEDWDYTMQLKLSNIYVKDIPRIIKTDIYEENVTYVFLIHGTVEDCHLRKIYKAPFLIPATCHQIQGTEDFTKIVIIRTSIDMKKIKWNTSKFVPVFGIPSVSESLGETSPEFENHIRMGGNSTLQTCKHTALY